MKSQGTNEASVSTQRVLASAIGVAITAMSGGHAFAADAPKKGEAITLESATAVGEQDQEQSYKVDEVSSPKYTAPLRDTPQTITVVPRQVIEDQNLLSLRDILSTVPGITFGAGEGGGGYGDSINLRGFSASNDIAIDGIRDSAQYTRSDSFNLEQVEVVNGASSVYSGSGSVGGTVNLVSKAPKLQDFNRISAGVGTDAYKRTTADINHRLNDTTAFRLNLMAHGNDAPGRDWENNERWGIAPSIAFGLGTSTRLTLSYFHQHDNNIPQFGVPFFEGSKVDGTDENAYYGYHNMDEQKIDSDSVTSKFEHDFNDAFTVRNLTRYSETDQKSIANPPQGTFCLPSGTTFAGVACGAPGTYVPSGPRGTTRDSTNTMLYNQTDLTSRFSTGFIEHTLVTGMTFSKELYDLDSGNSQRTATGGTYTYPAMDLSDPDSYYSGPQNYFRTGHNDSEVRNRAFYAFDTLKFNDQWEFNGGVRYERNEGDFHNKAYTYTAGVLTGTTVTDGDNSEDLVSYRAGIVYKPVENGSIYIAYGNSKTPSQSTVNGSCTTATCNVDPEKAISYELGTKWDLLDESLSLTAAVFRNDRSNYRVASGDPLVPDQQLDGEARVDGLALGAAGRITDQWSIFANYTYLKSKVLQSVSDFTEETTGIDAQKGNHLTFVPRNSFNVWTTYDLPLGFQLGYGVTMQSSQNVSSDDASKDIKVAGYAIHRAMLNYKVTRDLQLQLNVNNLFDKDYFARVRGGSHTSNGWATPGDARNATLTANYSF
ncbi:TonB-dependent siderophore receptor [Pseudomonas sp.]|uniref:TonB-dependent receptor n=1 Tax=Pseudomonas sp. TaxID=306 RepID=UPI0028A5E23B|nr:TonB-dependent siderophore receptor [Pseudomonas sp.]